MNTIEIIFQRRMLPNVDDPTEITEKAEEDESDHIYADPVIMYISDFPTFIKLMPFKVCNIMTGGLSGLDNADNRIAISLLLFIITMLYPIIVRSVFGILGFLISYQIYYRYGTLDNKDSGFGIVKWGGYEAHNCMCCILTLMTLWLINCAHPSLIGLCFGGIAHGVQFRDWNVFNAQVRQIIPKMCYHIQRTIDWTKLKKNEIYIG